jgi:hypothetical protein
VTYDVVPWSDLEGTLLDSSDFGPYLQQRLGDLSDPEYFASQMDILKEAQLIFLDGPKDGRFEPEFLKLLLPQIAGSRTLLVVDDIRTLSLLELWRTLPLPKMDVTSLGHWAGTGLAEA